MRALLLALAVGTLTVALPQDAAAQTPDPAVIAKGAEIYGRQCMRCHNLRSPSEFGDVNWRTIMAQMRMRANLTREEARDVLAFVQATNGIPGVAVASPNRAQPAQADTASELVGLTDRQMRELRAYLIHLTTVSQP